MCPAPPTAFVPRQIGSRFFCRVIVSLLSGLLDEGPCSCTSAASDGNTSAYIPTKNNQSKDQDRMRLAVWATASPGIAARISADYCGCQCRHPQFALSS